MAKFFFKKDIEREKPMHSQVVGIAWISVVLLLIAGLAIFLPKGAVTTAVDSCKTDQDTMALAKMEDSVYRARREKNTLLPPSKGDALSARLSQGNDRSVDRSLGDACGEGLTKGDNPGKGCPNPQTTAYKKKPLTVELNSADTTTLQLLHGIGPAYAHRIVRYRERLGGFISREQLLEVYGFTPELLAHIAPHITVDTLGIKRIDINSIPLKQLIKHPYVEYYQARDIINLRNRGVHFNNADDLRSIPSMADSTLERLLPYLYFGE